MRLGNIIYYLNGDSLGLEASVYFFLVGDNIPMSCDYEPAILIALLQNDGRRSTAGIARTRC